MSELSRRAVHLSGTGFPLLWLLDLVDWRGLQVLLVACAAGAAVLEAVRLTVGLDWRLFDRLTREYERGNPAGYALFAFSTAGVALAFRPPVAVAGMLMLSVGDPISGLLGAADAGNRKRAGVLAVMYGVCLAVGTAGLWGGGLPLGVAAGGAAVGALGATVADGTTPVVAGYVVDDNLSIPPVACAGIALALWVGGATTVWATTV